MCKIGRIKSETDAQIVAGMWVISCLDDNPGVSYSSVASRLNTKEENVRNKASEWRELFRLGINPNDSCHKRLDNLKQLAKIINITKKESDEIAKNSISQETWDRLYFRSQFRRELSAEKSRPDVIGFGLNYIESQRKAYLEFAAEKRQNEVYKAPLSAIKATLLVGFVAILGNIFVGLFGVYTTLEGNKLKAQELAIKVREMASKPQEVVTPAPSPNVLPAR